VLTSIDRLLQELDGLLLALESVALLVVQPSQLLENLGMVGVSIKNALVSGLSRVELTNQ
jgi:hypothetical protein